MNTAPQHPGTRLRNWAQANRISKWQICGAVGWSLMELSDFYDGHMWVTYAEGEKLAKLTGIPVGEWTNAAPPAVIDEDLQGRMGIAARITLMTMMGLSGLSLLGSTAYGNEAKDGCSLEKIAKAKAVLAIRCFMDGAGCPPEEGWKIVINQEKLSIFGFKYPVQEGQWDEIVYVSKLVNEAVCINTTIAGLE